MAALANGSTFSFKGSSYTVTSVTVDGPTPEVADVTSATDQAGRKVLAWTGDYTSPGSISVDGFGFVDPLGLIGQRGTAVFATPSGSLSRNVYCEQASVEARTQDVIRVRFRFVPTDYYG